MADRMTKRHNLRRCLPPCKLTAAMGQKLAQRRVAKSGHSIARVALNPRTRLRWAHNLVRGDGGEKPNQGHSKLRVSYESGRVKPPPLLCSAPKPAPDCLSARTSA